VSVFSIVAIPFPVSPFNSIKMFSIVIVEPSLLVKTMSSPDTSASTTEAPVLPVAPFRSVFAPTKIASVPSSKLK